jgi:hypothetical protein
VKRNVFVEQKVVQVLKGSIGTVNMKVVDEEANESFLDLVSPSSKPGSLFVAEFISCRLHSRRVFLAIVLLSCCISHGDSIPLHCQERFVRIRGMTQTGEPNRGEEDADHQLC